MTVELLRVEGVTKSFGHIEALTNVSLTINEGEIVGLVGSNGAGKTTLLRLLAGVYTPTDGAVVLSDGSKVEDARHRLGVVPESTGLYSRLTAWENIRYHSRLYGTSDEESWNRTVFFADRLDMKESLGRHTKGFSRGMRQKTALLRALAHAPDILLLDEPTAGVSPIVMDELFDRIIEVARTGIPILMVEQNARQALEIADRGYVLVQGRNAYTGSGQELLADREVLKSFLGG